MYDKIFLQPGVNFDQVRDGRRAPLFWLDIDLSAARSIAAGTAETVNIAGDSFATDLDPVNQGDAVVHFQDTNLSAQGAPVYVTRGQIVNVPFSKVLIENAAQPGKRLRVFYGVGLDFKPGAASSVNIAGTVSVIDGGKARTLANQVFGFRNSIGAGGAGVYNYAQLWNPVASGKRLVIKQMMISGVPGTVLIGNAIIGGAGGALNSKLSGGAAPSAAGYFVQTAGALAGVTQQIDGIPNGVPNVEQEPIVILPGYGLIVAGDVANTACTFTIHFIEESNT